MCATCGCGKGAQATVVDVETGAARLLDEGEEHMHADGTRHRHAASHTHDHSHPPHDHSHSPHDHHARPPLAAASARSATIDLEARVLAKNDALAAQNRAWFAGREILAINLLSSPGAGKTTLLERTIRELRDHRPIYVVEGDQETAHDGARIRAAGAPVVQLNTGTGCHLEAGMVARGLQELAPPVGAVVIVENVGNLVCPALFDLGERAKVAILSVTEGDDKPLKYPHMFRAADLILLNKIDLLPYVDFDLELATANALRVNPRLTVLRLSARTGAGMTEWYDWLRRQSVAARA